MGMYRIPKKAPVCRKYFFSSLIWACFATWTFGDSNLTGKLTGFTINAWSLPGRILLLSAHSMALFTTLRLLDDAIAGPSRGRDTIPFIGKRWSSVLLATFIYLFAYTLYYPLLAMFSDPAQFQAMAMPFYNSGYQNLSLVNCIAINAFTAFGGLFATLQLEKRISGRTGALLNLLCFIVFQYDPLKLTILRPASVDPKVFDMINSFTGGLAAKFNLNPIFIGLYVGTVVNAIRRRWAAKKRSREE